MADPRLITFASQDNDLLFDGTDFVLLTEKEALRDKLQQALRLRRGSCLYDLEAGFPWDQLHDSTDPVLYNTVLRNFLRDFPFITRIVSLDLNFEPENRRAFMEFEVETSLGDTIAVTFDTVVTA